MKKFFSMMMIAVAAFGLASCEQTPADDDNNQQGGGGTKTKLETPVLEVVDVEDYGFTVNWNAIEGADSYTVNLKGKNYSTTETSYKFDNLNAGTYDVRVKAVGEGYQDSSFASVSVTLSGATTVDWFTQTVYLPEEDPEEGIYRCNSVEFTWQGTDITDIQYGMFYADNLAGVAQEDIIAALSSLGANLEAILAEVNSEVGYSAGFYGQLDGGTNWALCVYVTHKDGKKFFTRNDIATEEAEATEEVKAWVGTWNAKTSQVLTIDQSGNGTLSDQVNEFTLTVTASPSAPNMVVVDGLSVLGEGETTVGEVYEVVVDEETGATANVLEIYTNNNVGYNAEQGIYYYWLPFIAIDGELAGLNMFEGAVPAHYLVMNADGTVTGETAKFGATTDGTEVTVEVVSTEIYGVGDSGQLYFFIDAFPAVYRAGALEVTKGAAPAAKRFSVAGRNYPMSLSSVVIR